MCFDPDYDPRCDDEREDARREAAEDAFYDRAWKCSDCGELWDPGEHRATRTDPAYVERDECPYCGGAPDFTPPEPRPLPTNLPLSVEDFMPKIAQPDEEVPFR